MSERETTATVPWRRWWAAAAVALSLVFLLALMASHAGAALGDRNPRRRTLAEEGATETPPATAAVTSANASASTAGDVDMKGGDAADGACEWPDVPETVLLKEKFWAFFQTVSVDSADGTGSLGYVQSSPFAWDDEQTWHDSTGSALAYSRHKWMQTSTIFFRDEVHVEDCNKRNLGAIADELQAAGMSEVNLLTISDPSGKVVATSTAQDDDKLVNIIDAASGKKVASVRRKRGWGPTDSWELHIDRAAAASGSVAADPRVLILALAAESSSVAWGLGAAGFIGFIAVILSLCAGLCIHMMRNADPKDHRYGIFAAFDRPGDHYEPIPAGIPSSGFGPGPSSGAAGSATAGGGASSLDGLQGGHRLGYGP